MNIIQFVSSHAFIGFVAPELLGAAPGWLPLYFAGPSAVALRAGIAGQTIDELAGQVLEGWRVSETPKALDYDPRAASTPVYRQANIKQLRLQLGAQHWASPQIEGRWCVQPGDVVLNKLAPVRAAFVSPAAKRHPVDGNTLIVRGLSAAEAAWVALCLNHAGYERLLFLDSGVLDRVGLKALTALRLPPIPTEMDGLSARLRDAIDEQTLAGEAMHHVRTEANELTRTAPTTRPLRSGAFFARDSVSHESWLPSAAELRAEQTALAESSDGSRSLTWPPGTIAHASCTLPRTRGRFVSATSERTSSWRPLTTRGRTSFRAARWRSHSSPARCCSRRSAVASAPPTSTTTCRGTPSRQTAGCACASARRRRRGRSCFQPMRSARRPRGSQWGLCSSSFRPTRYALCGYLYRRAKCATAGSAPSSGTTRSVAHRIASGLR
jgi:hypothetical protein